MEKVSEIQESDSNKRFFLADDDSEILIRPSAEMSKQSLVPTMQQYQDMYERSLRDPEGFWSEIGKHLFFRKSWTPGKFADYNFDVRKGPISIKWMQGAETNVCYNCLDKNVKNGLGDKVAFYWYGAYST